MSITNTVKILFILAVTLFLSSFVFITTAHAQCLEGYQCIEVEEITVDAQCTEVSCGLDGWCCRPGSRPSATYDAGEFDGTYDSGTSDGAYGSSGSGDSHTTSGTGSGSDGSSGGLSTGESDGGGVYNDGGGVYNDGTGSGSDGSRNLVNPLGFNSISGFLVAVIDIILKFAQPIIVLFIMYAGFLYVTARGDTSQIATARTALLWAVIGGVIVLGAHIIMEVIGGTVEDFRS